MQNICGLKLWTFVLANQRLDNEKKSIALRNLLSMTSGLDCEEWTQARVETLWTLESGSGGRKLWLVKTRYSAVGCRVFEYKMSESLLTLELAIPGLYATALKLTRGDKAIVNVNAALYITFACWLIALILTLMALTPRKWKTDVSILKQDPKKFEQALGIEDFFEQAALYKRRLMTVSSVLFFAGIFSAIFTM